MCAPPLCRSGVGVESIRPGGETTATIAAPTPPDLPLIAQGLAQTLREAGRDQGRREGELCGVRESVLDAFSVRFGVVPQSVRSAVTARAHLGVPRGWLRGVLRAADADAAEHMIAMR